MTIIKKYRQIPWMQQAKRIITVAVVTLLLLSPYMSGSPMNNGRGVAAIGMANTFVAIADNCWALEYNPAGLTNVKGWNSSLFFVPAQFGLTELRTIAFALTIPTPVVSTAIQLEQFGFTLYNEATVGIAVARRIDHNLSLGLRFTATQITFANYGSQLEYFLSIGILAQCLENINFGFHLESGLNGNQKLRLSDTYQLGTIGISWKALQDFTLSVELEKDIKYPTSIKFGCEKTILDVLAIRAGIADHPIKYSGGAGIAFSSVEFGYAGYSHIDLGWTHQIEVSILLGGKE